MIPHEWVPERVRGLHGTEIDGVPVVWEPESTWVVDAPMARISDALPGECAGRLCWCQDPAAAPPEIDDADYEYGYTYAARYTPEWPPPRFAGRP